MARERLDEATVRLGLAPTRSRAKAMIMAGDVLVRGLPVLQAGHLLKPDDTVSLKEKPRFVSRGGEKLDHALDVFGVDATGAVCADLGASTGGFTDCLLQRGAQRVYAIDVGYGQIDQKLRDDERVVVMERINARYLEELPEPVDLVVIDVSFISLALILPVARRILTDAGSCVPLVKPQFEAGKGEVGKGGVVRDPAIHRAVLEKSAAFAREHGFRVLGVTRSPIVGPAGNIEFLMHLSAAPGDQPDVEPMFVKALES
ncbi:MAG: TlyA family RNA methyltransferase [Thermomicrobiales bacterium]|nr:TlyA family RNA methyltransferase [Thermomicrobiales bacterium]